MKPISAADFHMHSSFSGDSQAPMEDMIQSAIKKGLTDICFTEHIDKDFPTDHHMDFSVDVPAYLESYTALSQKYREQIHIYFGIEMGLQPHLKDFYTDFIQKYPFDYCIGSSHLVDGMDPYYPDFFEGREESAAYERYFVTILENLDAFSAMDSYGHLDYIVRYGPNQNRDYSYQKYADIIDEILKKLIHKGVALECNTAGFRYGLGHPNPCEEILIRYRELGGELLTLGSDGHSPEHIAFAYETIGDLLRSCGYTHYTIFEKRKPRFLPLLV